VTRVVIAPDSFKGTLSATDAAAALAAGWRSVRPHDDLVELPQADGGEGTLDAIARAVPDCTVHSVEPVTGPDGRPVAARWLGMPDGSALVELAASSGLPLMAELDPLGATTRGLGEVLRAVLDAGAASVAIALGGSASTDGGAGALRALGLSLLDADGAAVPEGGAGLAEIATVDASRLRPPPRGGGVLLTDVTAPLLGPSGAAAVFGPQKGADAATVAVLEAGLERFAALIGGDPAAEGMGAAGGTAFGFAALWGASVRSGAEFVARATGLPASVRTADVVLTGEGRFDEQSSRGKVVGSIVALPTTARLGIVAGQIAIAAPCWAASLVDEAGSLAAAIAEPEHWLAVAGAQAARELGG
jgi:glycerate kinase